MKAKQGCRKGSSADRLVLVALMAAVAMWMVQPLPAQEIPEFSEAEIFLELNNTDGDLGLHAAIDGGPYQLLTIEDPRGRTILAFAAFGQLSRQGLTQLAFESAEPSFDELPPRRFFRRFPEGEYEIEGRTRDRVEFEATAFLSHVLAAPPENILISGVPAPEECDGPMVPIVSQPVTIEWDPVTESHPELGRPGPVEIVLYQLFVGDLAVDLSPEITEFTVPEGVLEPGEVIKLEIIARTETHNNTAVESCFAVSDN